MPIGGVLASQSVVMPAGVGYDIACGNCAVRTDLTAADLDVKNVMDEIWHEPTPMHVRNQKFEDYLTGEGVDPLTFGPFTRLAFNMHGLVPPEEWLDIMPQIFHVHAKFYDIDANGDEPAMDIPRIVKQFVDGGYTGYLSSEWEGHAFADLGEADPIDLVKKQHALMRRAIEDTVAAKEAAHV